MRNFLLKWLVNIIALFLVIHIIAGVSVDSWRSVKIAALVLRLLNTFLRPIILILTWPFTVLTLGFFTLIINGFLFYLASKFVAGFEIINFWSAFWAALLFSIVSFLLNILLSPRPKMRMSFSRYDNVIDVEGEVEDKK